MSSKHHDSHDTFASISASGSHAKVPPPPTTTITPHTNQFASCVAETMGSFIFGFVILASGANYSVAIALFISIVAFGPISGGHFNPGVSAMKYANGDIDLETFMKYFICQLAGFFAAWGLFMALYKQTKAVTPKSHVTSSNIESYFDDHDDE
jgi:glycerol uptake facilitator-like aquaporin